MSAWKRWLESVYLPGAARISSHMLFLSLPVALSLSVSGQAPEGANQKVQVLKPLAEVSKGAGGPVIRDGQDVDGKDFPVSFRAIDEKGETCTFFLVGRQSLMTAAHCVKPGTSITIPAINGEPFDASCETPVRYPGDTSQDWALCLLGKPFPIPLYPGKPITGYEVVNLDSRSIRIHQKVLITGFGCRAKGESGGPKYIIGWATIHELPPRAQVAGVYGRTPNAIKLIKAPASLCAGDSGGPAFAVSGDSYQFRSVIGVNSRAAYEVGYSFLSSLSTADSGGFLRSWAEKHKQRICGLHADAPDCRPTKP